MISLYPERKPNRTLIPWVPWGRLGNLRDPGLLAAPPRFHSAPAAPAAARRQGSRRSSGPRAAKCVTTQFCRVSLAAPPSAPRDFGLPEAARSRQEPPEQQSLGSLEGPQICLHRPRSLLGASILPTVLESLGVQLFPRWPHASHLQTVTASSNEKVLLPR